MKLLGRPIIFFRYLHTAALAASVYINLEPYLSNVDVIIFSRRLAIVEYVSFALKCYIRSFILF